MDLRVFPAGFPTLPLAFEEFGGNVLWGPALIPPFPQKRVEYNTGSDGNNDGGNNLAWVSIRKVLWRAGTYSNGHSTA